MDWYLASVERMQQARDRAAALRLAAAVWCLCWLDLGLCVTFLYCWVSL
jgi:hypothetical protein